MSDLLTVADQLRDTMARVPPRGPGERLRAAEKPNTKSRIAIESTPRRDAVQPPKELNMPAISRPPFWAFSLAVRPFK
jgi:hypothetical protein